MPQFPASLIAVLAMTKSRLDVPAEMVQSFWPNEPQLVDAGSDGSGSNMVAVLVPLTAKTIPGPREGDVEDTVMLSDCRGVGATA